MIKLTKAVWLIGPGQVRATRQDGGAIWVAPQHIVSIDARVERDDGKSTTIVNLVGAAFPVMETVGEIMAMPGMMMVYAPPLLQSNPFIDPREQYVRTWSYLR